MMNLFVQRRSLGSRVLLTDTFIRTYLRYNVCMDTRDTDRNTSCARWCVSNVGGVGL